MTCRYCGSSLYFRPVNVCICGRSGSWGPPYTPKLIDCSRAALDAPEWLKTIRRAWYSAFPANVPIIEAAVANARDRLK